MDEKVARDKVYEIVNLLWREGLTIAEGLNILTMSISNLILNLEDRDENFNIFLVGLVEYWKSIKDASFERISLKKDGDLESSLSTKNPDAS
jgi:hypothetical protein